MALDIRTPTSDEAVGGVVSGSAGTRYQAVDDHPDSAGADYLELGTTANSAITFGYSAFSLPSNATGISVRVAYYDAEPASGVNTAAGRIKVNGTYYDFGNHDPAGTSYTERVGTWALNPNTGLPWTYADINGSSSNPLQAFGVIGPDSNPVWRFSSIQLEVNYTVPDSNVANIRLDDVSPGTATSKTISYTVPSGSNKVLLLFVSMDTNAGKTIHAKTVPTYAGSGMTLIQNQSATGFYSRSYIYGLVNPAEGANDLVITYANANGCNMHIAGIVTLTGIDQTTPWSNAAGSTASSTSPSLSVTSASGKLVFGVMSTNSGANTASVSAGTQLWNLTPNTRFGCGSMDAGAASVTLSWTLSASVSWAMAGVSINPVAAGGGTAVPVFMHHLNMMAVN